MSETTTEPVDLINWPRVLRKARSIGESKGRAAGTWADVTEDNASKWLSGLDDNDPEVMDMLPACGLSGEWADDYGTRALDLDLGLSDYAQELGNGPAMDSVYEAFENGFDSGVTAEIERRARYMVEA